MRHFFPSPQKGLTLVEIIITLVLVGILAALGIPNMFKLLKQAKIRDSFNTVQNIFQDVQRQAVRRSESCRLELRKVNGTYFDRIRVTPLGCLTTVASSTETIGSTSYHSVVLPEGVKMNSNFRSTVPTITYSYKGHITGYTSLVANTQVPTVTVFGNEITNDGDYALFTARDQKKCLMVSSMLGLFRSGNYTGTDPNSVSNSSCSANTDGTR